MPDKDKEKSRVKVQVVEESSDEKTNEDKHEDPNHEEEEHDKHEHEEKDEHEEHESHEEHEDHEDNLKPQASNFPKQDKTPFGILFFAFLIGLTLGAGLIGGIFYYRSKVGKLETSQPPQKNVVNEEIPQPSPTPPVEEKLDLTKYSIQILNGSGIAGEAGRVETLLKSAGFTNTKTGNAGTYDFEETEVALKKDSPSALFDEIKKDLEKYVITKTDDLEDSSSYDVVITVGKSKS